jgi:hypothetical protein
MWVCPDSQEVGLEAAILERKRNSSLVKWTCAENVRGLKHTTEAMAALRKRSVRSEGRAGAWVEGTEVKLPA